MAPRRTRPGRAGCGWDCHLPFPLPAPDQVAHARQLINDDIKPAEGRPAPEGASRDLSPSQFSREYKSIFGNSPIADLQLSHL